MMNKTRICGSNYYYQDLNAKQSETILLVHGHPFDHSMWDYQLDALKDFRLVVPDLIGYGKSDDEFDKIFIEQQALYLALLLDGLDIDAVHLVGLSMGGQIIVEFARLFPHRTKSLVICGSNPAAENDATYQSRLGLATEIDQIGMVAYTDADIHKYLHKKTISENQEVYQHLYRLMAGTSTKGAVASHRGRAERRDNYHFLAQISVPVLVIVGDEDYFTPASEMKGMADQLDDGQFHVIADAGHMPNMEQPETFNKLLVDFYATL